MNPLYNSIVAIIFLIAGAAAVYIMLMVRGNPKGGTTSRRLLFAHRFCGYLFLLLFILMCFVMMKKCIMYREEYTCRAVIHMTLGIALVPLLAIKILTARYFKRLSSLLAPLGIVIYVTAFAMNGITAGFYLAHRTDISYVSISEADAPMLDEQTGRTLVNEKCSKCHTLERVFTSVKNEEEWTKTVNRMAALDAPNISDFDVKQIIHFLLIFNDQKKKSDEEGKTAVIEEERETTDAGQEAAKAEVERDGEKAAAEKKKKRAAQATALLKSKCTLCHDLERVYGEKASREEWVRIIERMVKHSKDPQFLSPQEKGSIADFLSAR
jgi:hypothetical protein